MNWSGRNWTLCRQCVNWSGRNCSLCRQCVNWSELFADSVFSLCLNWICFHMSFVQGGEIIECPIELQLAEGNLTAYVYNVSFSITTNT